MASPGARQATGIRATFGSRENPSENVIDALKVVKAGSQGTTGIAAPRNLAAGEAAPGAEPVGVVGVAARDELAARFDAVLKQLSRTELDPAQALMETAPPEVRELARRKLVSLTADEAVVELRAMLETLGRASRKVAGWVEEGGDAGWLSACKAASARSGGR